MYAHFVNPANRAYHLSTHRPPGDKADAYAIAQTAAIAQISPIHNHMNTARLISTISAATALALTACSSAPLASKSEPKQKLSPEDFRSTETIAATPQRNPEPVSIEPAADDTEPLAKTAVLLGRPRPRPTATTPPAASPASPRSIDQMVGQINGRPIYAHEFFAPMDARLRREAEQLPERQFARKLQQDIWEELQGKVADELLLAEWEARITPEQRMGVLAFIEQIRDTIVSRNFGAEDLAERRLLDSEGLTLDEKVDDVSKVQFVREQLRREIGDRVNVSYREIKQEFERSYDQFNPDPTARFRILMIPDEPEYRTHIAVVGHDLSQGYPFAEIVETVGQWRKDEGGLREVQLKSTTLADVMLFSAPELNDPARALKPGETTDRIEFNDAFWWIHLEDINNPPEITLYDVQLELEDMLLDRRQREESNKYFQELYDRGSFSDIELMGERLFQFGLERYLQ